MRLQDNLKRMGRARSCTRATTNEGGGEFKMAGASLLDLKATTIVARWSNHRKGVGFAFHTSPLTGNERDPNQSIQSFAQWKILLKLI